MSLSDWFCQSQVEVCHCAVQFQAIDWRYSNMLRTTQVNQDRETQPTPLTLEQVASLAKEIILRDGYHIPTVIAEGPKRVVAIQFSEVGKTSEERQSQMFQAGFALAQTHTISDLQQVFHVSEGWMSTGKLGELPRTPPSQDPNRKEVLLVMHFNVATERTDSKIWEMIRDTTGTLIDLKEFEPGADDAKSPLLSAFVLGFAHGSTDIEDTAQ